MFFYKKKMGHNKWYLLFLSVLICFISCNISCAQASASKKQPAYSKRKNKKKAHSSYLNKTQKQVIAGIGLIAIIVLIYKAFNDYKSPKPLKPTFNNSSQEKSLNVKPNEPSPPPSNSLQGEFYESTTFCSAVTTNALDVDLTGDYSKEKEDSFKDMLYGFFYEDQQKENLKKGVFKVDIDQDNGVKRAVDGFINALCSLDKKNINRVEETTLLQDYPLGNLLKEDYYSKLIDEINTFLNISYYLEKEENIELWKNPATFTPCKEEIPITYDQLLDLMDGRKTTHIFCSENPTEKLSKKQENYYDLRTKLRCMLQNKEVYEDINQENEEKLKEFLGNAMNYLKLKNEKYSIASSDYKMVYIDLKLSNISKRMVFILPEKYDVKIQCSPLEKPIDSFKLFPRTNSYRELWEKSSGPWRILISMKNEITVPIGVGCKGYYSFLSFSHDNTFMIILPMKIGRNLMVLNWIAIDGKEHEYTLSKCDEDNPSYALDCSLECFITQQLNYLSGYVAHPEIPSSSRRIQRMVHLYKEGKQVRGLFELYNKVEVTFNNEHNLQLKRKKYNESIEENKNKIIGLLGNRALTIDLIKGGGYDKYFWINSFLNGIAALKGLYAVKGIVVSGNVVSDQPNMKESTNQHFSPGISFVNRLFYQHPNPKSLFKNKEAGRLLGAARAYIFLNRKKFDLEIPNGVERQIIDFIMKPFWQFVLTRKFNFECSFLGVLTAKKEDKAKGLRNKISDPLEVIYSNSDQKDKNGYQAGIFIAIEKVVNIF